MKDVSHCI